MISVNLRPGTRRTVKRGGSPFAGLGSRFKGMGSGIKQPWQMAAAAAWGLVILGLGYLFLSTGARASSLSTELEEAYAEQTRYQGFLREKRREVMSRDSILAQIGTISAVDRERFTWTHILDEVGDALPENTWLTEVTAIAGAAPADSSGQVAPVVRVGGLTGDLAHYTAFLRRLEASPWLVNVMPLEAKTVIQGNRALTQFQIQATFSRADSSVIRTTPILESVVKE